MRLPFTFLPFLGVALLAGAEPRSRITVELDDKEPSRSRATLAVSGSEPITFAVGLGRKGLTQKGRAFQAERSLLGDFRINAILSKDRFEMDEELISKSGRSKAWLRENLFRSMNSIDFDGDGRGGEYGAGFLSLEPVGSETEQPFAFGEYRGTFRWYSYAIHGAQDEARIGRRSTGGCINVGVNAMQALLRSAKLGDVVEVGQRR